MKLLQHFPLDNSDQELEPIISFSRESSLFLRGLCILMVLTVHAGYMAGEAAIYLFLILSGYGLELSVRKNGLTHFWSKRLEAVWFPYLPIGLLILTVRGAYGPGQIICTLLGLDFSRNADATMWYISYSLGWYLGYYLAVKLSELMRRKSLQMAVRFILLILTGFFFRLLYLHGVWCENSAADNCILAFPLGTLLANLSDYHIPKKLHRAIWAIILFVTMAFMWKVYPRFFHIPTNYMQVFFAIAITQLFPLTGSWTKPIRWFGKYSFPIYLVEGLLLGVRNTWFAALVSQVLIDLAFIGTSAMAAVLYWDGVYQPIKQLFFSEKRQFNS